MDELKDKTQRRVRSMRSIYKISIVEDRPSDLTALRNALERYGKQKQVVFSITAYDSIEMFMVGYKGDSDVVFFDIELPGANGMEGAKLLRKLDDQVAIVFVTNLARFAIEGYQVNAVDYILKPVVYERFAVKLERILSRIQKQDSKYVVAKSVETTRRIDINEILYIEIMVHTLRYHLTNGEIVEVTGMLSRLEAELKDYGFARCKSCYLVNMKYIREIRGEEAVMINGDALKITRNKVKEFREKFMLYIAKREGEGR